MNKKVLSTLLAGTMVVTATSCSAAQPASETIAMHNAEATTVAYDMKTDSALNYAGAVSEAEEWAYETTAYGDYEEDFNTEEYNIIKENGFIDVVNNPLSTFAADVDTGSYCNLRRMIRDGWDLNNVASAIRTEEIVNYFDYTVDNADDVFSVQYSVGDCPWNKDNKLLIMTM